LYWRAMDFAGKQHTVLLRSDGTVVACGSNDDGQCNIPPLDEGLAYSHVSAGGDHTVLLRSDGAVVACGDNGYHNGIGQCSIPPLNEGLSYSHVSAEDSAEDRVIQLSCKHSPDGLCILTCTSLAGEDMCRLECGPKETTFGARRRMAQELDANVRHLKVILADGTLLNSAPPSRPILEHLTFLSASSESLLATSNT